MQTLNITQEWVMILDTQTGKIMSGAKGQTLYETSGHARKSLIHTSWWRTFREDQVVVEIGRPDLVHEKNKIIDEMDKLRASNKPIDRKLRDFLSNINSDIRQAKDAYNKANKAKNRWTTPTSDIADSIKFNNQTRFKIQKVLEIVVDDL